MTRKDPQFNVRIPRELVDGLRRLAATEHRSVTGQLVKILRDALKIVLKDSKK